MPRKQNSLNARGMKNENVGHSTNSKHDHTSRTSNRQDDMMEVAKESSSKKSSKKSTGSKKTTRKSK